VCCTGKPAGCRSARTRSNKVSQCGRSVTRSLWSACRGTYTRKSAPMPAHTKKALILSAEPFQIPVQCAPYHRCRQTRLRASFSPAKRWLINGLKATARVPPSGFLPNECDSNVNGQNGAIDCFAIVTLAPARRMNMSFHLDFYPALVWGLTFRIICIRLRPQFKSRHISIIETA
jgi:hypothetical protein